MKNTPPSEVNTIATEGINAMRINRREWLTKSTAIGLTTLGVGQVSGASTGEFTPSDYQESLSKRRENDWAVTEWRDHLVDKGTDIRVADTSKTVTFWESEDSSGDGTSSQEMDKRDISLNITYYIYDGAGDQIDLDWTLDPPGGPTRVNKHTQPPDDAAAIGWSDNDYVKDGDTYFDSYGHHLTAHNSVTPEGVAIGWKDAPAGLDAAQDGNGSVGGWFGVPVEPRSGSDPDQRRIFVDYYHVWLTGRITGIGFGSGGPAISWSIDTHNWVEQDNVHEEDAIEYIGGP